MMRILVMVPGTRRIERSTRATSAGAESMGVHFATTALPGSAKKPDLVALFWRVPPAGATPTGGHGDDAARADEVGVEVRTKLRSLLGDSSVVALPVRSGAALPDDRRAGGSSSSPTLAWDDPFDVHQARDAFRLRVDELRHRVREPPNARAFYVSAETGAHEQWSAIVELLGGFDENVLVLVAAPGGGVTAIPVHRHRGAGGAWTGDVERRVRDFAHLPRGAALLLTGPTGSGKTTLAERLHRAWHPPGTLASAPAAPFQAANCAAIPSTLVESELFGHEKGAFTGADRPRAGLFRLADRGTLFLDEVGELPLDVQAKLLTSLDSVDGRRKIRAVGAETTTSVDVRIVGGTNRDLHAEVQRARFRLDLLARLSVHEIHLPPLSSATYRIPAAYLSALARMRKRFGVRRFAFERDAIRQLLEFVLASDNPWSWNLRDVEQSAEQLAFAAYLASPFVRRGDIGDDVSDGGDGGLPAPASRRSRAIVTIGTSVVANETRRMRERWSRGSADDATNGVPAVDLGEMMDASEIARLGKLDRDEATWLLRARRITQSDAAAWDWLEHRGVYGPMPTAPGFRAQRNKSAAFGARWKKFAWRDPAT